MTDREIDPSFLPDTPLPPQDNTATDVGADEPRAPAQAGDAQARARGVEYVQDIPGGRKHPRVFIYPLPPELPEQPADGGGAGRVQSNDSAEPAPATELPSDRERARLQALQDRGTESAGSSVREDIDPVDQLVERVFPTRSFTDWLIADPLGRWGLFKEAIAKDPAGVDAAFDRARAVGYRAGRFTDALRALVAAEPLLKPTEPSPQELIASAFGRKREEEALYPGRDALAAKPGSDNGSSASRPGASRRFAQWALPPTLFARPPLVWRHLTPLEKLPKGEAGGPNAGRHFSRKDRFPDGTPCIYCGRPTRWTRKPSPDRLHHDHIHPRSRGGTSNPPNKAPACQTCNLGKRNLTPKEWHQLLEWRARGGV